MVDDGGRGRGRDGADAASGADRADAGDPLDLDPAMVRAAWGEMTGPDGYLAPLVLLFFTAVFAPLLGDTQLGSLITVTTATLAVVATLGRTVRQLRRRRNILLVSLVAWAAAVVAGIAGRGTGSMLPPLIIEVLFASLLLVSFPALLVRALQHRQVTLNTLCATMAAYLIIGLEFATVYRIWGLAAPPFFVQTATATPGQYTYFSFITLTTTGFGDFTAGSDPARSVVMVEAIIGQVFLVTIVARVVSLLGESRRLRTADGGGPGSPAGPA